MLHRSCFLTVLNQIGKKNMNFFLKFDREMHFLNHTIYLFTYLFICFLQLT